MGGTQQWLVDDLEVPYFRKPPIHEADSLLYTHPCAWKKNMPFETWCIARIYSSYQSEWGVHRLPTTSLVSGGKHENNKISHYTTITISYYTPSAKGKSIINGSFGWQSVNNFQREVRLSRSGHTCAMVKRQSWIFSNGYSLNGKCMEM